MKTKKDYFPVALGILCGIMAALLVLAFSNYGEWVYRAHAEALPSPNVADLVKLQGDLELSGAPIEMYVLECVRVNVARIGADGAWGDLTLPYVPPSIWGVVLFDGWHLMYGDWEQVNETTLRLHFWPEDLEKLDGTVGLYMLILAE